MLDPTEDPDNSGFANSWEPSDSVWKSEEESQVIYADVYQRIADGLRKRIALGYQPEPHEIELLNQYPTK